MNANRMKAVTRRWRGIPERATQIGLIVVASLGATALPLRATQRERIRTPQRSRTRPPCAIAARHQASQAAPDALER